jgi:hypothetical protein
MPTVEAVALAVVGAFVVPGAAISLGFYRLAGQPDPGLTPSEMISDEEVSKAVGAYVKAHGAGQAIRRRETYGPPGSRRRLLTVRVSGGRAGWLRMRARQIRGMRLDGVGHEAYAGDNWVVGRRGGVVVLMSQPKDVRWGVPGGLVWLLTVALGRMPESP